MDIDINTQNVTAAQVAKVLSAGTEVTLMDATYAVSIVPADAGFTVTDTTGGDMDVTTAEQAMQVAADFITNVVEDDADWAEVAAKLA